MTRSRSGLDGVPTDLNVKYYSSRAGYGLIFTEGSSPSEIGNGAPMSAPIHNEKQAQGWKKVVDAVHKNKGIIFIQLWHGGRAVHPNHIGGQQPWGPSPIAINGEAHTAKGKEKYQPPKEMTKEDI